MTKEEALAFLELAETATTADIKARLSEKHDHFETLSEKAPSDFLRRLNARNLDKVKTILKESAHWPSFTTMPEFMPAHKPEEVIEEPAQTVYIVSSLKESIVKDADNAAMAKERSMGGPAAWLIRHTENQPADTYPLHVGKNFVGRKQQAALAPFIVLEGDEFISRVQCVIYAGEDSPFEFYISDPSAFNNGKASKNGTYINGRPEAVTTKTKLTDGDTIQVGLTKFVIRFNTADIKIMVIEVEQRKYTATVVLQA